MERPEQDRNSSLVEAHPPAAQKQRPSFIRQLVLAYGISAGLILLTLIAQRTGMPILSHRYQEGVKQIWMLERTVERIESDLTTQEKGLQAYLMSGQLVFLDMLTVERERYLTDLGRAQELVKQVGDDAVKVRLERVHQLTEEWYRSHILPPVQLWRSGRPTLNLGEAAWAEGERHFNQLREAFADLKDRMRLATTRTEQRLLQQRRNFLIIACTGYIIGVLIGLIALIRSIRRIRRPLASFIKAAHQVGQGHFSIRVSGDPYAETAAVAQAFNRMAGEIAAKREETEELLHSLQQKNVELAEEHRQVEQASQFKSQFLTNVTHDLRTPLSSMVLYTDMLIKQKLGPLTPTQRDAVERILRRGKEQLRFVNELLDASRLDAKQMTLQLSPVKLTDLIEESIAVLQPQVESKGLQIDYQLPAEALIIEADRSRLLQVLNNLLENAVKFTPRGGHIWISATTRSEEVEVSITNSGATIDPQDLPFIFDRFYRGRHSDANRSAGTGLGLYIAKELVELHGGRLQASSDDGEHTTFRFTLRQPGDGALIRDVAAIS